MDLSKAKRGYFVGIGGVGVNALAKFVADFGIQISGSDAKINGLCNGLIKNGAKIGKIPDFFELENADFLVFSSAIPSDNPEIAKAREKDIPVFERHEFLARFQTCSVKRSQSQARTAKPRQPLCSHTFSKATT